MTSEANIAPNAYEALIKIGSLAQKRVDTQEEPVVTPETDPVQEEMEEGDELIVAPEVDPAQEAARAAAERRHFEDFERCHLVVDGDQRYNWSVIRKREDWPRYIAAIAASYPELWSTCHPEIIEVVVTKLIQRKEEPVRKRNVSAPFRDEVTQFMRTWYHESRGSRLILKSVYAVYLHWCSTKHTRGMSDSAFSRALRSVYRTHPYITFSRNSSDNFIIGFEKNSNPVSPPDIVSDPIAHPPHSKPLKP